VGIDTRPKLSRSSTAPVTPTTPTDLESATDLFGRVEISRRRRESNTLRLQNEQNLSFSFSENSPMPRQKRPSEPGLRPLAIQAHGTPGGVLINDVNGRPRWITGEALAMIQDGVQDSPITASARSKSSALCQRAVLSTEKGELKDAAWSWQEVITLFSETPTIDPDGGFQLIVLHELAQIYDKLGNFANAEACWMNALERSQVRFGKDNTNNFMFINHVASLYEKQGRPEDAAAMYRRSCAGRMRLLGPDDKETLMSLYGLGTVSLQLGDNQSAMQLYEQILPGLEDLFGPNNQMALNLMNSLSTLYKKLNIRTEAKDLSEEMVKRTFSHLGPDDALTREAVSLYLATTDNFDFSDELNSVLDHYRQTQSEDGIAVLQDLGKQYMMNGLLRSALEIFQFIFKMRKLNEGESHNNTLDALNYVCICLENLDVYDRAIQSLTTLQQLAARVPLDKRPHPYEKATRDRITTQRQQLGRLNQEWQMWNMDIAGLCHAPGCTNTTTSLCSSESLVQL
jgi:tetratricopeptide (TPR) repeat protein